MCLVTFRGNCFVLCTDLGHSFKIRLTSVCLSNIWFGFFSFIRMFHFICHFMFIWVAANTASKKWPQYDGWGQPKMLVHPVNWQMPEYCCVLLVLHLCRNAHRIKSCPLTSIKSAWNWLGGNFGQCSEESSFLEE